jgi:16S rRNA (uracil1498-N3)-methyltransferase
MSRARLHIPAKRISQSIALQPDETHYLCNVLRLGTGDHVEVFDGQNTTYSSALAKKDDHWYLLVESKGIKSDIDTPVHLGLALLKGKKLDQVIRMTTEIGVSSISIYPCQRSVPQLKGDKQQSKLNRFRAIAKEAARQSCRDSIPNIEFIESFADIVKSRPQAVRMILHEKCIKMTYRRYLSSNPGGEKLILIGPEGGFSDEEVRQATGSGFQEVGLGLPILKAETAAIVACAYALIQC